jgi:ABC-2 type transport system permease protein
LATDPALAGRMAGVVLGILFLVAAIGDATGSPIVWLSPFGWARHAQAYVANLFWVPLVPLLLAAMLFWLAVRLLRARDYATGLIPSRRGRASAAAWVRTPLALATRLQRGTVIGWAVALAFLGAMMGSVLASLDQQLAGTAFEDFARRHGGEVGEVFFQFVLYVLAQIAAAAALAAVLTLRSDETTGLAEPVLSRPVSRVRWAVAWWLTAVGVGAVILACLGLGAAVSSHRWTLPLATLAYLPAVLAVVGLALALIGWLPRAASAVNWTVLGLLLLLDLFAEFNLLPAEAVQLVSPFAATFSGLLSAGLAAPLAALSVIGLVLAALGVVGLRHRDLQLN